MKFYFITISCIVFSINCFSQTEIEAKKLIIHAAFGGLFQQHPELAHISFRNSSSDLSFQLQVFEKGKAGPDHQDIFDLAKKGDKYFFEKKYGRFYFPENLYQRFLDTSAYSFKLEGEIRHDSAFLTITHFYYTKKELKELDNIFEKVEVKVDYRKGLAVLASELQAELSGIAIDAKDSVIILRGIIDPKERFTIDKIITDDVDSRYVKSLVKAVNASGPWIPYEACGRKVKAYRQLYVQVNKDRTLMLALE